MGLLLIDPHYQHGRQPKTGILLVNLGSPDEPTPSALRRYLAEFLWDPRVVEFPRILWWLVLHGIILRFRPARSAKAYQRVWTDEGSPLIAISRRQAEAIANEMAARYGESTVVELAMRYGNPSIRHGLDTLRSQGVERVLVLPLYPQYSATTVASVFDEVSDVLRSWRWMPELRFINHYHDHPAYIDALVTSIRDHREGRDDSDRLMFSFHGIPQRYFDKGDPYFCHCQKTARLVAEGLGLADDAWMVVFQSRFGREPWLQPYCDKTLEALPAQDVKSVDVVCPGFAADCLETIEEIDMENREIFLGAGGESFHYIPALNDSASHIDALCGLLDENLAGWTSTVGDEELGRSAERARRLGAGS